MRKCLIASILLARSCARHPVSPEETPKAFGAEIVHINGEKQVVGVGAQLNQAVVVQVNSAQGAPVAGALVRFTGVGQIAFQPDHGLTGSAGQFTTSVTLGGSPGHYQIAAITQTALGKPLEVRIDAIALGYQEMVGQRINETHCIRCHDPESTPERVSNHDNLEPAPHAFNDGATLNAMTDANLLAIINHGGTAFNKSAQMPPYGNTLSKAEMDALVAYLRAVADPPYRPQGVFYAGN